MARNKFLSTWLIAVFTLSSVICPCAAMAFDTLDDGDSIHTHHVVIDHYEGKSGLSDINCLDDCDDDRSAAIAATQSTSDTHHLIPDLDALSPSMVAMLRRDYSRVTTGPPSKAYELPASTPVNRFDRLLD